MSLARKILIPALAATALITGSAIVGGVPASASIIGIGLGSGPTVAAAEQAAKRDLISNYRGCSLPPEFYVDKSGSGYTAEAVASCLNAS